MSAVPTLPRTGAVARTAANAMPATASTASSTATMVARRRPFLGARWDTAVARCSINLLPLRLEKLGNGLRRSRACQVGPGGSAAGLRQPQALQMGLRRVLAGPTDRTTRPDVLVWASVVPIEAVGRRPRRQGRWPARGRLDTARA